MLMMEVPSLANDVSEAEWDARVQLAAAYRLVAHFGWTHMVANHISLRVPGTEDQFLINPYGMLYEQVTASSLIKIDWTGKKLSESSYPVNQAGFVIHSAVHMARPDLHCILHTHTVPGQAVSTLKSGLMMMTMGHARFYNRIAYHDCEGVADRLDERETITRDLGNNKAMILRNHGLLTAGATIGEAFTLMYHLEKSCQIQIAVLSTNQPYELCSPELCEQIAQTFDKTGRSGGEREWPTLFALAEKLDPSFKD